MEDEVRKQRISEWYQKYSDAIYQFILIMIGDHEQAKDLTHDTFLKAYNHLAHFKGEMSDKNWLYRIARNVTIDFMRKRKPIRYFADSIMAFPSSDDSPERILQLGEAERQMYNSLSKLKRSYREVIILRKIKELSIQETAEVLGWKESKVKTTLFRGLQALKTQLQKEGYDHETI
ncbi:RNA polymerase sigma factor [Rossellomorea vietnamensis]|uniref:RNA polymerase sigma factor n=2 Tax=Rossellomorea TaxID=2837508 RepID=A0A5D4K629_9BACI|nr:MULTISPECIES: RNA polymerase sigma factor [Rossellomorea]TYR72496.1 RNA polymerase sigma factor [Rossellomorea vietnamensis]TYS69228.1 RNA polymerase sigma factor [Rossellomorea aquimaris]